MIRRRLVAWGRVQGVGFRWECAEEAERLGLHGWVRNRDDGTVEALAEGPADAVDQFVEWVREGPSYARVSRLQITEEPVQGLRGFQVVP